MGPPFILISPASRGLGLGLARHYLRTTTLPVVATHRSSAPDDIRTRLLSGLDNVDPQRLHLLHLELSSEDSIASAAELLGKNREQSGNGDAYIHTAFLTGGILYPERQPANFDAQHIRETFETNVISHLLMIKHFSPFLPPASASSGAALAKWVHISARVGSVSDNRFGGWYSYRASKAALNQVIRTFDLHLRAKKLPAVCIGVHPGTVKTDLSKEFWSSVPKEKLFEPEYAAERLAEVVHNLREDQRGRIWDWAGKEED
ncbi:hypothetical protein EIP86_003905 [Pleurotus ostreatoroseus]|nr:hypothetical protein EIP86_003905 [Pleurotus ostreatoroseus]